MINYDEEVEKVRDYNQPILDEFQSWLQNTGVTPKTIKNHIENIQFFSEYLVYEEPLQKVDEADADDVYSFLADWFPRKALWASESSMKSNMASFRKFFKFLGQSSRVDAETEAEVYNTLKEGKDEFLEAVAFEDDDEGKQNGGWPRAEGDLFGQPLINFGVVDPHRFIPALIVDSAHPLAARCSCSPF